MNTNTTEGKLEQLKGKVKQSVGEALGDEHLANSGTVDQVKGAAREAWGKSQDAVKSVADDTNDHAETQGHNLRTSIASAAQDVKDSISAKAEQVEVEHRRNA